MIKIDIVKRVADRLNLKDKEALAVVDTMIEALKESIKEYGRVEIRNFGVFQIKQRKPRTGRNPRNKKEYPIHPRRVVTFKLGKELKECSIPTPAEPPKPPKPPKPPAKSSGGSSVKESPRGTEISQPSLFSNDDTD